MAPRTDAVSNRPISTGPRPDAEPVEPTTKPKKKAPPESDCGSSSTVQQYRGPSNADAFCPVPLDASSAAPPPDALRAARVFLEAPSAATRSGLLDSLSTLSPAEFKAFFEAVKDRKDGSFDAMIKHLAADPAARRQFLELAKSSGVLGATPAMGAQSTGPIVAPPQPELLRNERSFPDSLRTMIRGENTARAREYLAAFEQYTQAWCAAVGQAKTPHDLRALGPFSAPPALSEPGWTERDQKDFGWRSGLTPSAPNLERAQRAVGDRISDLRKEGRAGSYGLEIEASANLTRGPISIGVVQEVTIDSRGADAGMKGKIGAKTGVKAPLPGRTDEGGLSGGTSLDTKGTRSVESKVSLGPASIGVEVERNVEGDVKTTFKAQAADGVGAYASVDSNGNTAVGVEAEHSVKVGDTKVEFGLKIGVTAFSVPKAYYQDVGGNQAGIFGPMPELDANLPWTSLKPDRRAWYERQGFTPENWTAR